MTDARLLTINAGSSSLKAAVYHLRVPAEAEITARADRIGAGGGQLRLLDARGETLHESREDLADHPAAVGALLDRLRPFGLGFAGIGHRIVHGGARYRAPVEIDRAVLSRLRTLAGVDPAHMPQAVAAVEATGRVYPGVPQVACFDTAFHARMPRVARHFPLPRRFAEEGIVRYGFHGLSYEHVVGELGRLDPHGSKGRVVVAHLGSGASMAAVKGGVGVDTTMGFTPTGGLVMGTRSGDLDPGVLLYLMRERGLTLREADEVVTERGGLRGVSGTSADMRDLLNRERDDPRAAEAVALFCYQAKKFLGALVAVLGGLDVLVFTGGIGEGSASVRARICEGLGHLGLRLEPDLNTAHAAVVSRDGGPVSVRVLPTDEELVIARHTRRIVARKGGEHVRV